MSFWFVLLTSALPVLQVCLLTLVGAALAHLVRHGPCSCIVNWHQVDQVYSHVHCGMPLSCQEIAPCINKSDIPLSSA